MGLKFMFHKKEALMNSQVQKPGDFKQLTNDASPQL